MPRNLILGTATGYKYAQMERFMRSLKDTDFDGRVGFLIDAGNDQLKNDLEVNGALPIVVQHSIQRFPRWLVDKRFNRGKMGFVHSLYSGLYKITPTSCHSVRLMMGSMGVFFSHIVGAARLYYFYKYLIRHKNEYSYVLLSDVRDVVFQGNPFVGVSTDKVMLFLEDKNFVLGEENVNKQWIEQYFDAETVARIGDKNILCGGTVLGPVDALIEYLGRMVDALMAIIPKSSGDFGVDQPVMNALFHQGHFDDICIAVENAKGPVYTLKLVEEDQLMFDKDNYLLSPEGKRVPVLHQYDWQPKVEAIVAKRYGVAY